MSALAGTLDIERFVHERDARWRKLETMLERWENEPTTWLERAWVVELLRLYRLACSDLNQARTYTANPELLGRLNQLVGRAYRIIYQVKRERPTWSAIARFFTVDVPTAFRAEARSIVLAAAAMLLGGLVGFAAILVEPANAEVLIPQMFYTDSPGDRVDRIENEPERVSTAEEAATFGSGLYTHNIQVAMLAFALGALTVAGGLILAFYNGVLLGAVAAGYFLDNVVTFFLAWVGPHGAFELPAIIFATAAGIRAGRAFYFPGDLTRAASLREGFASVSRIMITTAVILVGAGLIEGSFSQFSSKTIPYPAKIAVAVCLFVALVTWLYRPARRSVPHG
jgi:uncharacterized membrane protein SpoIIM required for sporulation